MDHQFGHGPIMSLYGLSPDSFFMQKHWIPTHSLLCDKPTFDVGVTLHGTKSFTLNCNVLYRKCITIYAKLFELQTSYGFLDDGLTFVATELIFSSKDL